MYVLVFLFAIFCLLTDAAADFWLFCGSTSSGNAYGWKYRFCNIEDVKNGHPTCTEVIQSALVFSRMDTSGEKRVAQLEGSSSLLMKFSGITSRWGDTVCSSFFHSMDFRLTDRFIVWKAVYGRDCGIFDFEGRRCKWKIKYHEYVYELGRSFFLCTTDIRVNRVGALTNGLYTHAGDDWH
ncbi:hypothetical protein BJ170DRAFT_678354 [Xylariales sp. AK1849]|nr:hypothetical protein BJ170DRAFT_678354 [Xylariales sp. AK1849]